MNIRYKEAFDRLNTSDNLEDRIISTCMSAEPENTPELRKRPVRLVPALTAAAVGVAVLGVSTYAVTTNIHKQADTYFMQNSANTELISEVEADSESRIYDEYYRELGLSAVSGDTAINLHGYVSDDQTVYLFGNITAPEGVALDYESEDGDPEYNYPYDYEFAEVVFDVGSSEKPWVFIPEFSFLPYDETVPNQREFVCKMFYSVIDFDWSCLTSITLTDLKKAPATHEERMDASFGEPVISGTWEFTNLDLTTTTQPVSLISEPVTISQYVDYMGRDVQVTYEDITISVFGIRTVILENEDEIHINPQSIVMKDGTVYEDMDQNPHNIFVDLSEVDYVQIGDDIFYLPE